MKKNAVAILLLLFLLSSSGMYAQTNDQYSRSPTRDQNLNHPANTNNGQDQTNNQNDYNSQDQSYVQGQQNEDYDRQHQDQNLDRGHDQMHNHDYDRGHDHMIDQRQNDFRTRKILNNVKDRLKSMEATLPVRMRNSDREAIHEQVTEIIHELNKLYPVEEAVQPEPMPDPDFNQLYNAVRNEPFFKGKKQIIMTSVNSNFFSLHQLINILSLFSFDNDKLDVIKMMYPRVLDRDQNYLLYKYLAFQSSKDQLGNYLRGFQK